MITTFSNFKTGQYHFRHSKCIEYNIKRLPATADSLFPSTQFYTYQTAIRVKSV